MRRKDKEITDKQKMVEILSAAQVVRLAMCNAGEPYLVAVNFAYAEGFLYIHSAKEGRKIDILKKNSRVAFQTDTGVELLLDPQGCDCTTKYQSVFGTGYVSLIDEKEEKRKALDAIMTKYTGRQGFEYPERAFEKTLILKVEIDFMSGKKSGE